MEAAIEEGQRLAFFADSDKIQTCASIRPANRAVGGMRMRTRHNRFSKTRRTGVFAILLCIASVVWAAPHPDAQAEQSRRPPYQVEGKVDTPRIFGEGVISTPEDEVGGAFSPRERGRLLAVGFCFAPFEVVMGR